MNSSRSFILVATLGLLGRGTAASAQSQAYTAKTRLIRAAVLTLNGDKTRNYEFTDTPYAFRNLDLATSVKPGGWTFVNPFAPGAVNEEIALRYGTNGLGTGSAPVGKLITKRNAAYWTVSLSQLSDTQISTYDVLLISPRQGVALNSFEREKLRRFVDGGGVLWVDMGRGAISDLYGLPFAIRRVPAGAGASSDPRSPLLNGPRRITGGDLNLLSVGANQGLGPPAPPQNNNAPIQNDISLIGEYGRYRPAAWLGGTPIMASARLGDGAIVVTTSQIALKLNGGTENITNFVGNDFALGAAGRAAARLAVNIVALGNDFSQAGAGSHKQGSVAADPGSPVLSRLTAQGTFGPNDTVKRASGSTPNGTPIGTPVTYKGFLVASIYDQNRDRYRVVVMDAVPGRDLDNDGDEDDGIVNAAGAVVEAWRDNSVGRPLDVIWVSEEIAQPISAPVCVEVPESQAVTKDFVLVKQAAGQLLGFELNRLSPNGRLVGDETRIHLFSLNPPQGGAANLNLDDRRLTAVIPPTVYDGLVYVADQISTSDGTPSGRIWVAELGRGAHMVSPISLNNPGQQGVPQGTWYVSAANAGIAQSLPAFTASPTIGYIPIQDNAGGQDRILYAPGFTGPNRQPALVSLWLGAKGEKPAAIDYQGTTLRITTRAGARGALAIYNPGGGAGGNPVMQQLAPRLSVTDTTTGLPVPLQNAGISVTAPVTGAETGSLNYTATLVNDWEQRYSFRIDYTIDWGYNPSELGPNIIRGRLILPTNKTTDNTSRILGPIALTPRGTLHFTQSSGSPVGNGSGGSTADSYWAVREDLGQGSFRIVTKYTLNQEYSQNFGSVAGTAVPAVLSDVDDVIQRRIRDALRLGPEFDKLTDFRFAGGVAVRNGVAYATINAKRNVTTGQPNGFPVMILAAFRAEPETPEIRIGAALGANPRIVQADFSRSAPGITGRQPTTSTLAGDRLNVDSENGVIRIESLASASREEITDSISLSQPIGISADASPATLRVPDSVGDRWSPLLWYGLWNGAQGQGTPLVAGAEVFLGATTQLPQLLSPRLGQNPTSAVIWSIDADHPTTGTFAKANPARPWLIQALQLVPKDAAIQNDAVVPNPAYRMPQLRGIAEFPDFTVRLWQTTLGNSASMFGVAGGNGSVVALGDEGIYGLSRADFTICDEGRLLRVDSSGNPVRNTFGGRFSGIGGGGGVAEIRPLVRPVKAYPIGESNTLVVDAGANRVVLLGEDGTELRAIDQIALDPNVKPAGYQANDPLTLSDPRDVATYEEYKDPGSGLSGHTQREFWVHYIVADSGNGRIVELVDRYALDNRGGIGGLVEVNGAPQAGILVWQSPSLEGATKIGTYYNSISRVYVGTFGTGRFVYVAGVSRGRATRNSAGLDNPNAGTRPAAGGGAIVVFDPLGGARVFDRFTMPDLTNTAFRDRSVPTNINFNVNTKASVPTQENRPFTGLASVTAQTFQNGANAAIRVMACDADAVYEFVINSDILANPEASTSLGVNWMINEAAFTALRPSSATSDANPRFFRPLYARRLDSGEVLVVNGYRGTTFANATYGGEVMMLDGSSYARGIDNLGFLASSVRFELPPLAGIRGLVSPVFADRR